MPILSQLIEGSPSTVFIESAGEPRNPPYRGMILSPGAFGDNPPAGRDARDGFINGVLPALVIGFGFRRFRHFFEFLMLICVAASSVNV
jgi:hypothetical protein